MVKVIRLAWWAAAVTLGYTFVVFPLVVALRAVVAPRPYRSAPIAPRVSLIIAARNEGAVIAAKLANIDRLEYPEDRLEVIVASDGSEDETEQIVAEHPGRRVQLLRLDHRGKAAALNAAVAQARGEILVFSDANSEYASDAIRRLVEPFADPLVGGVAGNQRYRRSAAADGSAEGERAYWGLDRLLKQAEGRAGNAISATGAIYAIRRRLFHEVPAGVTDDFYTSVNVIAQGHRLVFAPNAVAWEHVAPTGRVEFGRKVRVMTRGMRAIWMHRGLLDPRRHGFYAIQLLSHKLLRRLVWAPILVIGFTSPLLWRRGALYRLATLAEVAVCSLAAAGAIPGRRTPHKVLDLPRYALMVVAASLVATLNVIRGRQIDRWEPTSGGAAMTPSGRGHGTSPAQTSEGFAAMARRLERIRGEPSRAPDGSVVVPVNAQGDLGTVLSLLSDIAEYRGRHTFEVVLVVNNFPIGSTPPEIERYRHAGIRVLAIPSVLEPGYAPALRARMNGAQAALSECVLLFDADCRIPSATPLLDWYVRQISSGAGAAYTPVGHHDLPREWSVRAGVWMHHSARWAKRNVLGIPTTRGSNYAIARTPVLALYEQGLIADEMNVGPVVKSSGARVAYAGAPEFRVLTSARRLPGGWRRLARYAVFRLRYNLRVLPVRRDAASHTGRRDVPRSVPGPQLDDTDR